MRFDAYCLECMVHHQAEIARQQGGGETAYRFLRDVMQALLDAPEGVASPYLIPIFDKLFAKYYHAEDRYAEIKATSNRVMLEKLPGIRASIAGSDDPLLTALKYTQTGNYIDFGTPSGVHAEVLDELLANTPQAPIDDAEYAQFKEDLSHAKSLLYLGDNAGEIVTDLALVEVLRDRFPALAITFAVRGRPVLNDVTRADAKAVGMDRLAAIIDNGSDIPGTEPSLVGPEMRSALDRADVILAKGQGNYETLCPCGRNAYYMFLCKCERFEKMFGVPRLTGIFRGESRLPRFNAYF